MPRQTTARKISPGLQSRRLLEEYVLGTARFIEIPVKDLYVDQKYQRELNETAVTRMVSSYDPNLFEPPTVNDRHAWNGYKGPRWALIDGQHRRAMARKLGIETVTCRVISVAPEHEAQIFVELNRQRLWLSPMSQFHSELGSKNPAALEIENCLNERGLSVQQRKTEREPTKVACVVALKNIYASSGAVGLGKTMDVVLATWDETDPRRFSGIIVQGIHRFISKNRNADLDKLADRLSRMTATSLLAKASARYYAWKSLGAHKSHLDGVVDEIGKAYRRR